MDNVEKIYYGNKDRMLALLDTVREEVAAGNIDGLALVGAGTNEIDGIISGVVVGNDLFTLLGGVSYIHNIIGNQIESPYGENDDE